MLQHAVVHAAICKQLAREKRAQAAREAARDSVWGDASEWDYRDRRAVA
jgi:hypothetical protein